MKSRILVPGVANGALMRLEEPVSFWGGVDVVSGRIIATGHPQHGASMEGRIIALERSIGSSSGSSVLLELLANGRGPAGVILGEADLILTLGAVIAREMGYASIPVLLLPIAAFSRLPAVLSIDEQGGINAGQSGS